MNSGWNTAANWFNGLVGAFIGAAAGVTSVLGADAIGSAYGIPPGFSPYQPGGLKKLGGVALIMGVQGAFTWLKQHPTPFDTTLKMTSTTSAQGQTPVTTTVTAETHSEPSKPVEPPKP